MSLLAMVCIFQESSVRPSIHEYIPYSLEVIEQKYNQESEGITISLLLWIFKWVEATSLQINMINNWEVRAWMEFGLEDNIGMWSHLV